MRECNGCTLCCKLVAVPELNKPQDVWCVHCDKSRGCTIHESPEKPEACSKFDCLWLQGLLPEWMVPNKVHVVFGSTTDGHRVQCFVDQGYPDAAERNPVRAVIDKMVDGGIDVIIIRGDKRKILTSRQDTLTQIQSVTEKGR